MHLQGSEGEGTCTNVAPSVTLAGRDNTMLI